MTKGQQRRQLLTAKPTSAFVYLRVSTDQQARSGAGIKAQFDKCKEHAERLGIPVIGVYRDEGISGKDGIDKRPGLRMLIEEQKNYPESVVIVYSLSRLGRSQRLIWQLLDTYGEYALPLSSATEPFETATPMGRAMLGMLGVWAQLESDLVSQRTVDALAAVAARGKKLGAPSMKDLRPDIVRKVQEMYGTGEYTHRTLAQTLNEQRVPTVRRGHKWHPKTVRTALMCKLGENDKWS